LNYQLAVEFEHYKWRAINLNNHNLFFVKNGTVHEPEVFEAALTGYHIDTSDFVINTSHNERALEPHYNMWINYLDLIISIINILYSNRS